LSGPTRAGGSSGLKGRKLLASAVWLDALTNGMGPREAADNWDLPQDAIILA
jgi:hypothetical protein